MDVVGVIPVYFPARASAGAAISSIAASRLIHGKKTAKSTFPTRGTSVGHAAVVTSIATGMAVDAFVSTASDPL